MAQPSPYFDSASRNIDEGKAALLKAVADGGTAGKAAFDAAQAQATQAKQEAVSRAAERSALYGVGGDSQTFLGAYDTRANQMGVNRANFESGLAQTQASGESYLEKARASIPTLQAININKGTELDNKFKTAIEVAKQKALADQEKENRSLQRTLDAESRAEARATARELRAAERAAAKEAKAAAKKDMPSNQGLLGLASQAAKGSVNPAINAKAAGPSLPSQGGFARDLPDQGLTNIAATIGRQLGIPEAQLAELFAPGFQASLTTAVQKPEQLLAQTRPDIKWLTQNVRGMDTKKAEQALAAPEFKEAGNQVAAYFSIAPLDESGLIADESPYTGLKPREALRRYIYSQPGNLTMKDAVMQYYGRMLPG